MTLPFCPSRGGKEGLGVRGTWPFDFVGLLSTRTRYVPPGSRQHTCQTSLTSPQAPSIVSGSCQEFMTKLKYAGHYPLSLPAYPARTQRGEGTRTSRKQWADNGPEVV